jgi:hypothetical protein
VCSAGATPRRFRLGEPGVGFLPERPSPSWSRAGVLARSRGHGQAWATGRQRCQAACQWCVDAAAACRTPTEGSGTPPARRGHWPRSGSGRSLRHLTSSISEDTIFERSPSKASLQAPDFLPSTLSVRPSVCLSVRPSACLPVRHTPSWPLRLPHHCVGGVGVPFFPWRVLQRLDVSVCLSVCWPSYVWAAWLAVCRSVCPSAVSRRARVVTASSVLQDCAFWDPPPPPNFCRLFATRALRLRMLAHENGTP